MTRYIRGIHAISALEHPKSNRNVVSFLQLQLALSCCIGDALRHSAIPGGLRPPRQPCLGGRSKRDDWIRNALADMELDEQVQRIEHGVGENRRQEIPGALV